MSLVVGMEALGAESVGAGVTVFIGRPQASAATDAASAAWLTNRVIDVGMKLGNGAGIPSLTVRRPDVLRRTLQQGTRMTELTRTEVDAAEARLTRQLSFLIEIDRLKSIIRQTSLCDGSRRENSAEHSWHLAMMALVMAEHAGADIDVALVVKMLLVHDLVEIDAGDTFAYDASGYVGKEERERAAAERLFGLLPADQAADLRALWDEFESGETAEARYANALDRLQPLLANHHSKGGSWRAHGVSRAQVIRRMAPIERALPGVWPVVLDIVGQNCALGHIRPDE